MRYGLLLASLLLLGPYVSAAAFDCEDCCLEGRPATPACKAHGCFCGTTSPPDAAGDDNETAKRGHSFHRAPARPALSQEGDASSAATPTELTAARVYLRAKDIPPKTAAYGIVALRSRPTSASRDKLMRVCAAYKSFLPTNASLPTSVTDDKKMLTVWPLDNPDAPEAKADDCVFVLDHYDLYAGQAAIKDAANGGDKVVGGDGPYLIGWSPSQSRGVKDKLVLVIDLGTVDTQAGIDDRFKFWQKEIIDKPEQWKHGFSLEGLRISLRDFVDRYGSDLIAAVALVKPH